MFVLLKICGGQASGLEFRILILYKALQCLNLYRQNPAIIYKCKGIGIFFPPLGQQE